MGQRLTAEDFNHAFRYFRREAFRLECQPVYRVDEEREMVEDFLTNPSPRPVTEYPFYAAWLGRVREAASHGRRLMRVRVMEEPPTDYQRWEAWAGVHNAAAGENLRYISRSRAIEVGLPVTDDWWLFDNSTLAIVRFGPGGEPRGGELISDAEPDVLARYRQWRDLAVHHSTHDLRCPTAQEQA